MSLSGLASEHFNKRFLIDLRGIVALAYRLAIMQAPRQFGVVLQASEA